VKEYRFATLAEARARMPFSARWSEAMKDHYSAHSFAIAADGGATWRYYPPGVVETEHSLETPIWDRIHVSAPTLVLRGSESAVFSRDKMDRLVSMIPGARCGEIDADHRVSQDNPDALAAALDTFIGSL
jgi:pimeloyl-ACP methyl ester carboxylesterase